MSILAMKKNTNGVYCFDVISAAGDFVTTISVNAATATAAYGKALRQVKIYEYIKPVVDISV